MGLSLVLGEVVHVPSLLQLQAETKLPQWQRWGGYQQEISHDTFGYASARMDPARLRRAGVWICRKLKRGKAFERHKIGGCWLSVWMPTNSFAATTAVVRIV